MTTGFLASCANNKFFKDAFELGINQYKNDNYQSCGAHLIYRLLGVEIYSRVEAKLKERYCDNSFYNMPTDVVYYYDWVQAKESWKIGVGSELFPKEAISYHWFGGIEESQKYNRLLNEDNFREYYTTFSVIANEIISKPRVSIITSYYNRKPQFIKTLKTIQKSSVKDFELIVVDDASDDEHRLELLQNDYPFMKIIRIEIVDKWWRNPSVPFNIGIKQAKGDIIILQNPECKHSTDILAHAIKNISAENYISYCTYALSPDETDGISAIDFKDSSRWYSHPVHRPAYFHFCSAIKKSNMDKINGFDERYATGFDYDDNDLVERIKRLGLTMMITEQSDALVFHQYHASVVYNQPDAAELCLKNKNLFQNVTLKEKTARVNIENSYIISFKDGQGRADNLRSQLEHLQQVIDTQSEIIIVEQDSFSRLDWLEKVDVSFCINHIFVKNDDIFNKGRGYNIGVKAAKGSKLIFADCDVLLQKSLYKKGIDLLAENDAVNPYSHLIYLNKEETELFLMRKFATRYTPFPTTLNSVTSGGVCMIKKDKFIEIKGFDEEICGWGAEDSIFDEKMKRMGFKIHHIKNDTPAAHIWHPDSSLGGNHRLLPQKPYYKNVEKNNKAYEGYLKMDKQQMVAKINSVKEWGV
jgi:GT2 family glycosyltransferase